MTTGVHDHGEGPDPLGRYVGPGHTRAQDVDDPRQGSAVIRRQSAWAPLTPRRAGWEQRGDTLPQIIRHKIIRHPQKSAVHQPNCQALSQSHGSARGYSYHDSCSVLHSRGGGKG